jgi:predicted nuclease of predicted toxin-antitoxin system
LRFLVDSCAGGRLAAWLRQDGHDVFEASLLEADPGDKELLQLAATEERILVTLDKYFGALIFHQRTPHSGLILLPDVRVSERLRLVERVLERHGDKLESGAVITVRGGHLRVAWPPAREA